LFAPFEPPLLLYSTVEGHTKSEKAFFTLAAAGFQVSFHPLHVFHVLEQLT
jgi:hypothetical protein